MKPLKVLAGIGLAIWSLFVFLASNGPADVEARARAWAESPIFGRIPVALLSFASSRPVIAATCFIVGGYIGWRLGRRATKKLPWWSTLATDMSLLAHTISETRGFADVNRLNADLGVTGLKARRRGLEFPSPEQGFRTFPDFLPYLHRVSALLGAGEVRAAREMSKELSEAPLE